MKSVTDSQELEEIVPELWGRGIDAVKIGDWSSPNSEQEICIVNPRCIIRGDGESFMVFNKNRFNEPTSDEITDIYNQALSPPERPVK